jgi:hypothetical protein
LLRPKSQADSHYIFKLEDQFGLYSRWSGISSAELQVAMGRQTD